MRFYLLYRSGDPKVGEIVKMTDGYTVRKGEIQKVKTCTHKQLGRHIEKRNIKQVLKIDNIINREINKQTESYNNSENTHEKGKILTE